MVDCPNCNRYYNDDFDFCPYCGTKKPAPKTCPNCEIETYAPFSFCPKCGTELISKIEFDAEINSVIKYIDNGDFDNAISKCTQLKLEKKYNGPTIHALLKSIDDIIEREEEMKKDEERNSAFREMIELSDFDSTSKSRLIAKINNNEIRTDEEFIDLINAEESKMECRKIVEDSGLDTTLKSELITKINNNEIRDEYELKEVITEIERKIKFKKIVEDADLDSTSKSKIINQIDKNYIRFESTLKKEINNEKGKTESRRYFKIIEEKRNESFRCPKCNHRRINEAEKCPYCGYIFTISKGTTFQEKIDSMLKSNRKQEVNRIIGEHKKKTEQPKIQEELKYAQEKDLTKSEEIYLNSLDEKIESLEKLYNEEKDNLILNEINKILKEKENFIERRR